VLVLHNSLPCACLECTALEQKLKQLGAFCPRSQLLTQKQDSRNNSTLAFLEDSSTFVVVHRQALLKDVLNFLVLQTEAQLQRINVLRFDWVHDSVAAKQHLTGA